MSSFHGVMFATLNPYVEKYSNRDFGLTLSNQNIGTPTPKTHTVSVNGMNGEIDLTEAFGEVKYNNRQLNFTFSCVEDLKSWEVRKTNVANFLHGQKMKIMTWSDPNYYYIGRCTVDEYNSSRTLGTIVISCNCEPFKYHHPIRTVTINVGDNTIENSRMPVYADLYCEQQVRLNDKEFTAGNYLKAFKLTSGTNYITSNGTATLTFREGEL